MQLAAQDVDGLPFDVQDDYVDVLLALDPLADLELVDIQLTQVAVMTLRLPLKVSKQQVPLPSRYWQPFYTEFAFVLGMALVKIM